MKNIVKGAIISLFAFVFFACAHHNPDLDISVTESDDEYKFSAYFDEARTRDVQRFVNRSIEPNGIFSGEDDRLDVDTKLQDRTSFKLKASPGELIIKISKIENTPASVARIRKMCEGIKGIITE
jgi:hypothetical protein